MLYVNQIGRRQDDTMEAMKSLIKCDVIYITESDFVTVIQEVLRWEELFNTIKDQHLKNEIIEEQKQQSFNILRINDFIVDGFIR